MFKYISDIDPSFLSTYLGRDMTDDEKKEIFRDAQDHLDEYSDECVWWNCDAILKLKIWKNITLVINRHMTNEERNIIAEKIKCNPYMYENGEIKDTPLMELVNTWK
jgi:hypothetical protein